MALGYCPAILLHLQEVAKQNYSGSKVTIQGMLAMLLAQPNRPNVIEQGGFTNGHNRPVNIKYKPRTVLAQTTDTASCEIDLVPAYKETTVSVDKYAGIGIHVPDSVVRQYCQDASNMVTLGTPPTMLMNEHLDSILHAMNGIYARMETALTTQMALTFGRNVRSGLTDTTINFNDDGTVNLFSEGMSRILADSEISELCGPYNIVGNGNFHVWDLQNRFGAMNFNQSGINSGPMSSWYERFYLSQITASTWGANDIGVFGEGSVHLIQDIKNAGSFGGRHGAVEKTVITDPRVQCWAPGGFENLKFDLKVKYLDCPTELTNGYSGGTQTYQEGYALFIGTNYGLFVQPTDAFDGADVAAGQNGTLRFSITNS